MKSAIAAAMTCGLLACGAALAQAPATGGPPPLSVYGGLPEIDLLCLSPDGTGLSMVRRLDGKQAVVALNADMRPLARVGTDEIRTRRMAYLSPTAIMLQASTATDARGALRDEFEYSTAFVLNLETKKVVKLLGDTSTVYPFQSGLGRVVGVSPDGKTAFMPAYSQPSKVKRTGSRLGAQLDNPDKLPYSLFAVDLATGLGQIIETGTEHSQDWFVGRDGKVLLEESFNRNARTFRVISHAGGKPVTLLERTDVDIPNMGVLGLLPDETGFVFYDSDGETSGNFVKVSITDGKVLGPAINEDVGDSYSGILTPQRHILGFSVSGLKPRYVFFDPALQADMAALSEAFAGAAVRLEEFSADQSRLLVHVSGTGMPPGWFRFDRKTKEAEFLSPQYPGLEPEDIAPVEAFTYTARDGLKIEAVLTGRPARGAAPKPLILMPHGGPASQDVIGFDWMAQALASRGYVVLQPNFRGSTGYGLDFLNAGRGEWGGAMQDDLSDGVKALEEAGIAAPGQACIVGASYGGYAALMGGASTPELFRCVVAVAPVSDPKELLREVMSDEGRDSEALRYWKRQLGVETLSDASLKDISPMRLSSRFDDPVLILHGEDDTVVSYAHATRMRDALKRSGKDVTLVKLKAEDHWLSLGPTRLQALEEIDAFVRRHLPVG
jgi:dipeptidyl aminopeptidase/acylaminoacyl peptidase